MYSSDSARWSTGTKSIGSSMSGASPVSAIILNSEQMAVSVLHAPRTRSPVTSYGR